MNTNKPKLKTLPKSTKFATVNSDNEDDFLLEALIALLILNGTPFKKLFPPSELFTNKKEEAEFNNRATNIILDFVNLNPKYAEMLKQNDKTHKFLNSLGLDSSPNEMNPY